jgi:hypothetical protein
VRVFKTKTGVELRVLDGGLSEVESIDSEFDIPEIDQESLRLEAAFGRSNIVLKQVDYIGLSAFELTVKFSVDALEYSQSKNRQAYIGGLTVDLSNYLSRSHGFREYSVPTVDLNIRAKNNIKTFVFKYIVSDKTAYSMGLSENESMVCIQRGA